MVEELVPAEQLFLRTTGNRLDRTMWGSSLGGVVSFYTVWQYPEIFGGAVLHVEHLLSTKTICSNEC